MKRPLIFAGVAIATLMSTFLGMPSAQAVAVVPDDSLAGELYRSTFTPLSSMPNSDITIADLNSVTGFSSVTFVGDPGPVTLVGAEYLTGITDIRITLDGIDGWGGPIQLTSLSPLSGLGNLQRLTLWKTQISDLTPLAGLTGLVGLNLTLNNISDVSSLAGMLNLSCLVLDGNHILDMSPLNAAFPSGVPTYDGTNGICGGGTYTADARGVGFSVKWQTATVFKRVRWTISATSRATGQ